MRSDEKQEKLQQLNENFPSSHKSRLEAAGHEQTLQRVAAYANACAVHVLSACLLEE